MLFGVLIYNNIRYFIGKYFVLLFYLKKIRKKSKGEPNYGLIIQQVNERHINYYFYHSKNNISYFIFKSEFYQLSLRLKYC